MGVIGDFVPPRDLLSVSVLRSLLTDRTEH
jgi:hypothetical protein